MYGCKPEHTCYPRRPEEYTGYCKTEVTVEDTKWILETRPKYSARTIFINHWTSSPCTKIIVIIIKEGLRYLSKSHKDS